MEGAPQFESTKEEPTYEGREVTEQAAMKEAERIFHERGLDEMSGFEQAASLVNIMEELAEQGNEKRHVVEALARITTIVDADNGAHSLKEKHPEAAIALGR